MPRDKQCMSCMEFFDGSLDTCPCCGAAADAETSFVLHIKPGTLLNGGRYVVGRALGYGSFGVTYIGWDRILQHKIVLKEYLPSEYATRMADAPGVVVPEEADGQYDRYTRGLKRFRAEAQTLAALGRIDGVVYIYDTFEENNTAYIVMEYLRGETLKAYLQREGIQSEQRTLNLMIPVLNALSAVHEAGIIHRDISPENIMIQEDDDGNPTDVKLIDFGAAKFMATTHSKSLTVLLQQGYSPEEQYRSGGEQGTYTDVYALAAVMYEMVTGVRPPDALERRTRIEQGKRDLLRPPGDYNRNLSANFETALLNALNVKIEDRTETVDAFAAELVSFEKVPRRGASIRRIDFYRWPLWAKIGVPLAGLVAVATVVGGILYLSGPYEPDAHSSLPDGYVYAADFTGLPLDEAGQIAGEKGLVLLSSGTQFEGKRPEDTVLRQNIAPGTVLVRNSTVSLTVSTREKRFLMPDVHGMKQEAAMEALSCISGVNVTIKNSDSPGLAPDCVSAQSVPAYSELFYSGVPIDIALTVTPKSAATQEAAPLELDGLTLEQVLAKAAEAGAAIYVAERVFTEDVAEETVLTAKTEGGEIALTLASPPQEFQMPNLKYLSREDALHLARNYGLRVTERKEYSEIIAAGFVISQSPEKETAARSGQALELVVSNGSKPFSMPNVANLSEEVARKNLEEKGLAVSVNLDYTEDVEAGLVISQDIAPGQEVVRGTSVTLTVCSDSVLKTVTDVTGMTQEEAENTLRELGFKVQTSQANSTKVAAGHVISQLPEALSRQKEGTEVVLTVSSGPVPTPKPTATAKNGPTPAPSTPTPEPEPEVGYAEEGLAWSVNAGGVYLSGAYYGETLNGVPHGVGTLVVSSGSGSWQAGDRLLANWVNGEPSGAATGFSGEESFTLYF